MQLHRLSEGKRGHREQRGQCGQRGQRGALQAAKGSWRKLLIDIACVDPKKKFAPNFMPHGFFLQLFSYQL